MSKKTPTPPPTDLGTMQIITHEWISQFPEGYWPLPEMLTQIDEESAEVGREVSHLYGAKKKKKGEKLGSIKEEIGDLLFSLCCLANKTGIQLAYTSHPGTLAEKRNQPTGQITDTTIILRLAADHIEYLNEMMRSPHGCMVSLVRWKGFIAESVLSSLDAVKGDVRRQKVLASRLGQMIFVIALLVHAVADQESFTLAEAFATSMAKRNQRDNIRFKRHEK